MLTIAPPRAVLIMAGMGGLESRKPGPPFALPPPPVFLGLLLDDAAAAADADIVVEEVEPAPALDGGLDQPLAFGLMGDIAGHGRGTAALGLDHCDRARGKPEIEIGHHYL